jgi:hypothetical protein
MKTKLLCITAALSTLLSAKPVHIDEILTKAHSFKLDITTSYANIKRSSGASVPLTYQTQNGDVVSVPTYIGESSSDQDYLSTLFTLRYGLTQDIELFGTAGLYYSQTRIALGETYRRISDKGVNALSIGATYQVKKETQTPSLLIGASAKVLERTKIGGRTITAHGKQYRLFATSFYTVDPVVFLLNTSYTFNRTVDPGGVDMRNGDILSLSPSIYFAVNPYTSLNWGIKYTHYGASRLGGKQITGSESSLSFQMGMSYEISNSSIIDINAEHLDMTQSVQNTLSLTYSYKF